MESLYNITPSITRAEIFQQHQTASDAAMVFNLNTTSDLHADAKLNGYGEDADFVVTVSHVHTILAQPNRLERKVCTVIGWLADI